MINYVSQMGQDKWVADTLHQKKGGVFIDIGAGHPVSINNTYALEKEYEWTGLSFDLGPPHAHGVSADFSVQEYIDLWDSMRSTSLICGDALEMNFEDIFAEHGLPEQMDYLSIDLEPPMVTYEALLRLPLSKYKFNTITFETDVYREARTQGPSQNLLKKLGYTLRRSDRQEDWYVHSSLVL